MSNYWQEEAIKYLEWAAKKAQKDEDFTLGLALLTAASAIADDFKFHLEAENKWLKTHLAAPKQTKGSEEKL